MSGLRVVSAHGYQRLSSQSLSKILHTFGAGGSAAGIVYGKHVRIETGSALDEGMSKP